jgi:uncharacterized protein YyaL (SSP411 family)
MPLYEVAIVGDLYKDKRREWDQHYLPNVILMGGPSEGTLDLLQDKLVRGQTTIYVCSNKVCRFPVTEVPKAVQQIGK